MLGLQRWRSSSEKTALVEVVKGFDSFKARDFRKIAYQLLGSKQEAKAAKFLTELIEDGTVERVAIGEYRIFKNSEVQKR